MSRSSCRSRAGRADSARLGGGRGRDDRVGGGGCDEDAEVVGVRHLDQVGVDAVVAQGLREGPSYCRVDGGVAGAVDDGDGDLAVLLC